MILKTIIRKIKDGGKNEEGYNDDNNNKENKEEGEEIRVTRQTEERLGVVGRRGFPRDERRCTPVIVAASSC